MALLMKGVIVLVDHANEMKGVIVVLVRGVCIVVRGVVILLGGMVLLIKGVVILLGGGSVDERCGNTIGGHGSVCEERHESAVCGEHGEGGVG